MNKPTISGNVMARKKSITRSEGFKALWLLLPYGIPFTLFILVPVIAAVGLSFTAFDVINTPKFTGFLNYVSIFTQDTVFLKNVLSTRFCTRWSWVPAGMCCRF